MTKKVQIEDAIKQAQEQLEYDDARAVGSFISFHPKERQAVNRLEKLFRERFGVQKGRALAILSVIALEELGVK